MSMFEVFGTEPIFNPLFPEKQTDHHILPVRWHNTECAARWEKKSDKENTWEIWKHINMHSLNDKFWEDVYEETRIPARCLTRRPAKHF